MSVKRLLGVFFLVIGSALTFVQAHAIAGDSNYTYAVPFTGHEIGMILGLIGLVAVMVTGIILILDKGK